jgi:hypothetical protein
MFWVIVLTMYNFILGKHGRRTFSKLLHVLGYRFNNVQFYFGKTRKAHVFTATNTTQESMHCIIPMQRI